MDSNSLAPLAKYADIPEGQAIVVLAAEGREIALFNIEGKIYALDNACPHIGGPLGEGEIEDQCVTCPWHGWQFDVTTGKASQNPAVGVSCYPVEIRAGEIFVDVA